LENRDRKYDHDVYKMRGIYQRADQDFDLQQFGLFLQTGTLFMTFHLNDMVALLGRRLMAGDVLELQHLKDYDALDDSLPVALKRYYVVGDASFATEGFTPTWFPHLWRVRLTPLVDSQEYKDILNNISAGNGGNTSANTSPIGQILSSLQTYQNVNDAIIQQAEIDVPKSGYDTSKMFTLSINPLTGESMSDTSASADNSITADNSATSSDAGVLSPANKIGGYLVGDGTAPNGLPTGAGISFPERASKGDYYLRLDYMPNRLFRYDGGRWVKVEDSVRTNLTPGAANNQTQRSGYVNDTKTFTDASGNTHNELQSLSKILRPGADN
jgi:hypothetical protein